MLDHLTPRSVTTLGRPAQLYLGQGAMPLEVIVVEGDVRPKAVFEERHRGRAAPLVAVVRMAGRTSVYGGSEHEPVDLERVDDAVITRILGRALEAKDRHHATRFLARKLPQLQSSVPGLRNEGLFALHELTKGVPARADWESACARAAASMTKRGRPLLKSLGFEIQNMQGPGVLLTNHTGSRALAVLLEQEDEMVSAAPRFDGSRPVSWALARADREGVEYLLMLAGSTIRIYRTTGDHVVPGRRSRADTYLELDLDLLPPEHAGYLDLIYSANAIGRGGSFSQIAQTSADYAAELGGRLRDRVYDHVVPSLAAGIIAGDPSLRPTEILDMALYALYRLLFIAYAEDRDLLPLHVSTTYREHSLKRIAQRLLEFEEKGGAYGEEPHLWGQLKLLFKAVDRGNPEWSVPTYNGGLFSSDPEVSPIGARLAKIEISDRFLGPALSSLLLDTGDDVVRGPVDFRSLGVREFGTIYEGLLESELSEAETDLAVRGKENVYLPARPGETVAVHAGEIYLHNRSGARKSTGSYYTKHFAVEHLLDKALEPALDEHFERLDKLSEREAGRRFFEFRVADISMGSAHFLAAALDRIERRFVNYLAARRLPDVTEELRRLRTSALEALGEDWAGGEIEDAQLLRRQIARRCIFGVDLNPMAVELARLSMWIHSFVPGLPLSLLNQNLIHGNSLVGIATFEEAEELLGAETGDLFSGLASSRLEPVREPVRKLAQLTDASDAEIKEARALYREVHERLSQEAELLTILTASRTNAEIPNEVSSGVLQTRADEQGSAFYQGLLRAARREVEGLEVLHFPIRFPHVFMGDRPGFDVILGNPPWEEATVEEDAFWGRHFPGLRGLPQREQEARKAEYRKDRPDLVVALEDEQAAAEGLRRQLNGGAYPGMGTGDPDLYKAFVWRFWDLLSDDGGRIGVVLPRSALSAKGSGEFRRAVFSGAALVDLTMLENKGEWAFDGVEPRYTIGLTSIVRRPSPLDGRLVLRGPYSSLERFRTGVTGPAVDFPVNEVEVWNDDLCLPLLPSEKSAGVFAQLRQSPRLDVDEEKLWRARPQREFDATNDKKFMDVDSKERPEGFWPVMKGESFDIWIPDTGTYYGWADPHVVVTELQRKRSRTTSRSAFAEFSEEWRKDPGTLPCLHPRVAFRDISRATDTRTMRAALLPPQVVLTNKAPYFVFPRGSSNDEAYLLGVLSSIPLDWYARRFVEVSVNYFIINPFPIPRPPEGHPLRKRVIELAGRLACPDDRFADWAKKVGVEHGPLDPDLKQDMIHELDAVVARLYGLSEDHLAHIFETFHEGWDYEPRLAEVLRHFRKTPEADL